MTMIGSSDTGSAATPSPAAPASAPSAASVAEAAQAQIDAMNRDATHPLHPDNRHADPAKLEQVFELYQRAHGPSADPTHAPAAEWPAFPPAAQEVYDGIRESVTRGGALPPVDDGRHMSASEFDDLVGRICTVESDRQEVARVIAEAGSALWHSSPFDLAAEKAELEAAWGERFGEKMEQVAALIGAMFDGDAERLTA